jgi:TPR repeat protein
MLKSNPISLDPIRQEALKGPVDQKFKGLLLTMPGSGSHTHVSAQLLEPLKKARKDLKALAASAITSLPPSSGVATGLGIQLFKRAQRMRAHSFQNRDVAECARINQEAEQLLKKAMGLGNLQACAALAEMYLSRDKVGVKPDIMEHMPMAVDLVSEFDSDPDCMGVLAYCHFKYNMLNEAAPLAAQSAQAVSKYGQFVCGLIQRTQRNYAGAHQWFSLAAGQNFDEAQIGLAELYSSGHMGGTKEEDKKEARRLLELAAVQGNDKAILHIGISYGDEAIALKKESRTDEADAQYEQACRWLQFAVEANANGADNALRVMRIQFEESTRKKKKEK